MKPCVKCGSTERYPATPPATLGDCKLCAKNIRAKKASKVNTCGHPERKHVSKGRCDACYRKARRKDRPIADAKVAEQQSLRSARLSEEARKGVPGMGYFKRKATSFKQRGALCSWKELAEMWERCKGFCEQCDSIVSLGVQGPTAAHFDHNHKTGAMRRVLCLDCNDAQTHVDSGKVKWV
jgi:hypothetical protein